MRGIFRQGWVNSFSLPLGQLYTVSDTFKKEEVNLATYYDFDTARLAIFEYIEFWYNRKKLHSSIVYMTPQQFEDLIKKSA
ncbi:IS3 family transposase [Thermoanaerobacter sp. RKWS2]|uniref:IS3 family transposase n=1 Tax=Thermoanaerobacter sp. RKWS2 TaxID=2983842 RepID=UPI002B05F647|nr:IS3 family transposase [Thermoanaerobacter sp. RKWS2]